MAIYSREYADDPKRTLSTIFGETDVTSYASWATTIDFTHGIATGVGSTVQYTVALEILEGGRFMTVDSKYGSFNSPVYPSSTSVMSVFYLAGRKAGTYRITGYYTIGSTTYIHNTNPFSVNR